MLKLINKKTIFNSSILQPYQLQLQYVSSYDDFKIPVHTIGKGSPVLMLHAFGMDARQFLPFLWPLTDKYCFYLPHLRGWGLSAHSPSNKFDFIEQYADDVDVLLKYICHQHQTDAVDVAAISMGALVMWAYFNRFPNCNSHNLRNKDIEGYSSAYHEAFNDKVYKTKYIKNNVKRYLNIDQSPVVHNQADWQGGVFGEQQAEMFEHFANVLKATLPYIDDNSFTEFSHLPYPLKLKITEIETMFSLLSVNRLHSRWFVNTLNYQPSHKLALFEHKTWLQKLHALQAYLELPFDYREALNKTEIPVTMLIGGQSQLYSPKWQREVANRLPNSKIIEIEKSGHAIPLDAPVAFARTLKQFLITH